MKVKHLSLLAGAGSLLVAGAAEAALVGIVIEHHSTQQISSDGVNEGTGNVYNTYRIYAQFDQEVAVTAVTGAWFNLVDGVAGTGFFGNGQGINPAQAGPAAGAEFNNTIFNARLGGSHQAFPTTMANFASFYNDEPKMEFDTMATLGWWGQDDYGYYTGDVTGDLAFQPAFGSGAAVGPHSATGFGGNNFLGNWDSGKGTGWFAAPIDTDPNTQLPIFSEHQKAKAENDFKVGIFQVTLQEGWFFEAGFETIGTFEFANLTSPDGGYVTNVPAPGVLALLGLAGLAGTRRRRA